VGKTAPGTEENVMQGNFEQELDLCHMTLERALHCVNDMRKIYGFIDLNTQNKTNRQTPDDLNAQIIDHFFDAMTLGGSKVVVANTQMEAIRKKFNQIVKSNDLIIE
jgi:hypothetical protein